MRFNNPTNKHDRTRFTVNETSIYFNIINYLNNLPILLPSVYDSKLIQQTLNNLPILPPNPVEPLIAPHKAARPTPPQVNLLFQF